MDGKRVKAITQVVNNRIQFNWVCMKLNAQGNLEHRSDVLHV